MKKWVSYLTVGSIVLSSMPMTTIAAEVPVLLDQKIENQERNNQGATVAETSEESEESILENDAENFGESLSSDEEVIFESEVGDDNQQSSMLPVQKMTESIQETKMSEDPQFEATKSLDETGNKVIKQPRSTEQFEIEASGGFDYINLGIRGGIHPAPGGAYGFFNPTAIKMSKHTDPWDGYLGGFFYHDGPDQSYPAVLSDSININPNEGDFYYHLKARVTGTTGVTDSGDNGYLSYQNLKTTSEVKITGQDGVEVINGLGQVPVNPTSLSISRPATDTYGDATYQWEIVNDTGEVIMSGTEKSQLPTSEELADTVLFPPGTYTLHNTVTETVPESSKYFGVTNPATGELLSVNDSTEGDFLIQVLGNLVVNHYIEGASKPFDKKETTKPVGEPFQTVPSENIPLGYELDESQLPVTEGEYEKEDQVVNYYYKKKLITIEVEHKVANGDGTFSDLPGSALETLTGKFGDNYDTSSIKESGYDFVETTGLQPNGTYPPESGKITYIYQRKETNLIVKHVDMAGNEIKDPVAKPTSTPGKYEEPYETTPVKIPGYRYVKLSPESDKQNDFYGIEDKTVVFMYEQIVPKITVHFVDEDGNKISPSTPEKDGVWGEDYVTTPKTDIEGYELVVEKLPANAEGTFADEDVEVTYVYKKKATQVIVHHQYVDGKEFAKDVLINGFYNEDYQTKPVIKSGYVIIKVIGETVGKHREVIKEITYVYAEILPPLVHPTMEGGKIVTGTGIPNTDIEITFPDGTVKKGHVDNKGNWKMDVPTGLYLKEGDHIKAVTVDYLTGLRSTVAIGPVIPLNHPVLSKPDNPDKDKETPKDSDEKHKGTTPPSKSNKYQNKLPQTGEKLMQNTLLQGMSLIILAAGYYVFNRKRNTEK